MRKFWHAIVGHRYRQVCRLCVELRYHLDDHDPYLRCRCGATKDVTA